MVPMDVPGVALDMMVTFLYSDTKGSFATYKQSITPVVPKEGGGADCPEPAKNDANGGADCPVCVGGDDDGVDDGNDDADLICTEELCVERFQQLQGGEGLSPVVSGIVWGVVAFATLSILAFFLGGGGAGTLREIFSGFFRRRRRLGLGQVEMPEVISQKQQGQQLGSGYRDDNSITGGDDDAMDAIDRAIERSGRLGCDTGGAYSDEEDILGGDPRGATTFANNRNGTSSSAAGATPNPGII